MMDYKLDKIYLDADTIKSDIPSEWPTSPDLEGNILAFYIIVVLMDVGWTFFLLYITYYTLLKDYFDTLFYKVNLKMKLFKAKIVYSHLNKDRFLRIFKKPSKWSKQYFILLLIESLESVEEWKCCSCKMDIKGHVCEPCGYKAFRWRCWFCRSGDIPSNVKYCPDCGGRSKTLRKCRECRVHFATSKCGLCSIRNWKCDQCDLTHQMGEMCDFGHKPFKWMCECKAPGLQYGSECFFCMAEFREILYMCIVCNKFFMQDSCPNCRLLHPVYKCCGCGTNTRGKFCNKCHLQHEQYYCSKCHIIHFSKKCICERGDTHCPICLTEKEAWICDFNHRNSCINTFSKCLACYKAPIKKFSSLEELPAAEIVEPDYKWTCVRCRTLNPLNQSTCKTCSKGYVKYTCTNCRTETYGLLCHICQLRLSKMIRCPICKGIVYGNSCRKKCIVKSSTKLLKMCGYNVSKCLDCSQEMSEDVCKMCGYSRLDDTEQCRKCRMTKLYKDICVKCSPQVRWWICVTCTYVTDKPRCPGCSIPPKPWKCSCNALTASYYKACRVCKTPRPKWTCLNCYTRTEGTVCQNCHERPFYWKCFNCDQFTCEESCVCGYVFPTWTCECQNITCGDNCVHCGHKPQTYCCPKCHSVVIGIRCDVCEYTMPHWNCSNCKKISRGEHCIYCSTIETKPSVPSSMMSSLNVSDISENELFENKFYTKEPSKVSKASAFFSQSKNAFFKSKPLTKIKSNVASISQSKNDLDNPVSTNCNTNNVRYQSFIKNKKVYEDLIEIYEA